MILSVVASGLVFFEVPINWTSFATGGVILVAVAADSALRRTGRRRSEVPRGPEPGSRRQGPLSEPGSLWSSLLEAVMHSRSRTWSAALGALVLLATAGCGSDAVPAAGTASSRWAFRSPTSP
jgi:hypothetical protein